MNDLIPSKINPIEVFQPGGLDEILCQIEKQARSLVPDLETYKGRREIASMARRVVSSKVALDDLGKTLVSEMRRKVTAVDTERRLMRQRLDALRDEVRQPLTEWEEEEKKRVDAIKKRLNKIKPFNGSIEEIEKGIEELRSIDPHSFDDFESKAFEKILVALNHSQINLEHAKEVKKQEHAREMERQRVIEEERQREKLRKQEEAARRLLDIVPVTGTASEIESGIAKLQALDASEFGDLAQQAQDAKGRALQASQRNHVQALMREAQQKMAFLIRPKKDGRPEEIAQHLASLRGLHVSQFAPLLNEARARLEEAIRDTNEALKKANAEQRLTEIDAATGTPEEIRKGIEELEEIDPGEFGVLERQAKKLIKQAIQESRVNLAFVVAEEARVAEEAQQVEQVVEPTAESDLKQMLKVLVKELDHAIDQSRFTFVRQTALDIVYLMDRSPEFKQGKESEARP